RQRHAVGGAEAALRRPGTLGEALQRFVFDGLQEQMPLVVDQAALREAGFEPQRIIGSARMAAPGKGVWGSMGLTYVPAPAAPLLTTHRRWLDWRQGQALPERLDEAIAQAVAHGQDALGQFSRADVWMRTEPALRREHLAGAAVVTDWIGQSWTEWAPGLEQTDVDSLIGVDGAAVRGLGLFGGALCLLSLVVARRRLSSANRLRLLILVFVAALCTMVSLPITLGELVFWPAVALALGLAFEYPRFLTGSRGKTARQAPSTQRRPPVAVGAGLLLALSMGGWFAQAQNATTPTVYFAEAGSDRSLALVPPDLLKRLDDLRQRAAQPAQGAVLTSAQYLGKAENAATAWQ